MNQCIAAVVVFYNPDQHQIQRALSSTVSLDLLVLIDNSFVPVLDEKNLPARVIYKHYPENIGISRALNLAFATADDHGCQYIITLDQDSIFNFENLPNLLSCFSEYPMAAIISPRHSHPLYLGSSNSPDIEKVPQVMTSGNVVSISAWRKVHGFDEHYFIDFVDIDFCLRLRQLGYIILINNKVVLPHSEGNLKLVRLLGLQARTFNYPPYRWYYKTRNYFYLKATLGGHFPEQVKIEGKKIIKDIIKSLIFEDCRYKKVKNIMHGLLDFVRKRYGKNPNSKYNSP